MTARNNPQPVVSVGWASGPAYAGAFILDDPIRGVLDGTTYTLAADTLVELAGVTALSTTSGRSGRYTGPTAGTMTVTVNDPTRALDPTNEDGPYYGQLTTRRPIRMAARWRVGATVVDVPTWGGYVQSIVGTYDGPRGTATVTATDVVGLLAGVKVPATDAAGNRPAETVATRLRYLLSPAVVGFVIPEGTVDAGRIVAAEDLRGADVLQVIGRLELADLGRFVPTPVGGWGYVSGLDSSAPTVVVTGAPQAAETLPQLPARTIPMAATMARYANRVTVTALGGTPQVAADADEIAERGAVDLAWDGIPLASDADALDLATTLLARHLKVQPVPTGAVVALDAADSALGAAGAAAPGLAALTNLAATMRVDTYYATGSPTYLTSVGIVDAVAHAWTPSAGSWTVTVSATLLDDGGLTLILDDPTRGVLDVARLGY